MTPLQACGVLRSWARLGRSHACSEGRPASGCLAEWGLSLALEGGELNGVSLSFLGCL